MERAPQRQYETKANEDEIAYRRHASACHSTTPCHLLFAKQREATAANHYLHHIRTLFQPMRNTNRCVLYWNPMFIFGRLGFCVFQADFLFCILSWCNRYFANFPYFIFDVTPMVLYSQETYPIWIRNFIETSAESMASEAAILTYPNEEIGG